MNPEQQRLWLLDAGHAPDREGKHSPPLPDGFVLHEWQFARDVCDRVAKRLDDLRIAYHVLTPRTNYDVLPSKRARMANFVSAQVPLPSTLLSIHANKANNSGEFVKAGGVCVLYYPYSEKSHELAELLQANIICHTDAHDYALRDRGTKARDDVTLLKACNMPAVLAELGFYTDPEEVLILRSDAGRQTFADAIVAFIIQIEDRDAAKKRE